LDLFLKYRIYSENPTAGILKPSMVTEKVKPFYDPKFNLSRKWKKLPNGQESYPQELYKGRKSSY